jgi:Family of unknown function (DUF6194)
VDIQQPTDGPGAGDTFFIYDPDRNLEGKHQIPFATIVTKDYGDFDNASKLNRDGVYRLNIGLSRETFSTVVRPGPELDYTVFDELLPHPVYATQSWVCIVNPTEATFATTLEPLLAEAYQRAAQRHPAR